MLGCSHQHDPLGILLVLVPDITIRSWCWIPTGSEAPWAGSRRRIGCHTGEEGEDKHRLWRKVLDSEGCGDARGPHECRAVCLSGPPEQVFPRSVFLTRHPNQQSTSARFCVCLRLFPTCFFHHAFCLALEKLEAGAHKILTNVSCCAQARRNGDRHNVYICIRLCVQGLRG